MKYFIRFLFVIAFCFCGTTVTLAYNKVSFYVAAHQDDWQLFMGDMLFGDAIDTNTKVVVIHTTAGDASCGTPLNKQYYRARESGAINSLEFCADIHSIHRRSFFDTTTVNGHSIRRFTNKNVINYFLMIPDGCYKCGWRGESLEYLQKSENTALLTVDSMNSYSNWEDLISTVKALMTTEAQHISSIHLNVADVDSSINPGDHPDHLYSALMALVAAKEMPNLTVNLFTEYHAADMPPNLSYAAIALKGALYALADFGITESDIQTKWFSHQEYLTRTYYRTVKDSTSQLIERFLGLTDINQAYLYPNPAHDVCYLNYKLTGSTVLDISITDVRGTLVQSVLSENKGPGYYSTKVGLTGLAKGNYIILIQTQNNKKTLRLVVD